MEQALLVHIELRNDGFGSAKERDALLHLQDQIEREVEEAAAGELDGDMFGEGECILYLYGPDADRLFDVVRPLLKSCAHVNRGYAIKRYRDTLDAREVRVVWD
jgi:hypothetical protein